MENQENTQKTEENFVRWDDIKGHDRVVERLRRLSSKGRVPHSMLFTGTEGIGKRLTAKALAASLLCLHPENGIPCGCCEACRAIDVGTHPDFYYLEPESKGKSLAKSIRIEQIRDLETKLALAPKLSTTRVAILDGAELMNEAAENSLLKTIEEPVGPMVFILITDSPDSLLDTIRSRCVRMEFGLLPPEIIAGHLAKLGATEAEAASIGAIAEGSIGKAIRLFRGDGISLREDAVRTLESLLSSKGMTTQEIWDKGTEFSAMPRENLDEWLGFLAMLLRDLLVLYSGAHELLYHRDMLEKLADMAGKLQKNKAEAMLSIVRDMRHRLLANVNLKLQLDGMLIRLQDAAKQD